MTPPRDTLRERLEDLLIERATVGIVDETNELEIEALLRKVPDLDPLEFELAAAAADLAMMGSIGEMNEPMPASVRANVERVLTDAVRNGVFSADAQQKSATGVPGGARVAGDAGLRLAVEQSGQIAGGPGTRQQQASGGGRQGVLASLGWLVAAAAFVIAAIGWLRIPASTDPQGVSPTASAEPSAVLQLVANAPDCARWDWNPWEAKPEGGRSIGEQNDVAGEVAWSTSHQTGVMRFVGLPPNDPEHFQYQLWIIDPAQKHPIDGGVFDVPTVGECLVTIDPKIRVSGVAAFAITLERPGGVVVSDQDVRVVIAAPPPTPFSADDAATKPATAG